jgi:hypothetical protein
MPATSPAPDIEIYLHATDTTLIQEWLVQRMAMATPPVWRPAGKKQWKTTLFFEGKPIPALIIEEASPGFISVWLDSAHTPWANDHDCAREAFTHLGGVIRATTGSWQEGDDPDLWWEISASGERELHWPG